MADVASLDDIAADLIGAMTALESNNLAGPGADCGRFPIDLLDEGQRLMLREAHRRIEQVLTELNRESFAGIAAFLDPDQEEGAA